MKPEDITYGHLMIGHMDKKYRTLIRRIFSKFNETEKKHLRIFLDYKLEFFFLRKLLLQLQFMKNHYNKDVVFCVDEDGEFGGFSIYDQLYGIFNGDSQVKYLKSYQWYAYSIALPEEGIWVNIVPYKMSKKKKKQYARITSNILSVNKSMLTISLKRV